MKWIGRKWQCYLLADRGLTYQLQVRNYRCVTWQWISFSAPERSSFEFADWGGLLLFSVPLAAAALPFWQRREAEFIVAAADVKWGHPGECRTGTSGGVFPCRSEWVSLNKMDVWADTIVWETSIITHHLSALVVVHSWTDKTSASKSLVHIKEGNECIFFCVLQFTNTDKWNKI